MAVDFDLTKETIQKILSGVNEGSAFAYASNLTTCPNPGLDIHGLGVIGLPLSNHDAQAVISKAKQSPFGHRETTVVDTSIRNSWELDATQFTLRNPSWQIQLQSMISAVHSALKLKCEVGCVSAELYKLLLYEAGAFFKPHRDSEKTPGMFGTLIVCLPSPHQGGDLLLTHNGAKLEHKTGPMSDFNFSFAAWYSDITHEVRPVTNGHRLVLTYNLIRRDSTSSIPLRISSATTLESWLMNELKDYDTLLQQEANKVPKFLVYKLDQKYTQASLKAERLGTQDHDRVQLLQKVAQQVGFEVWLGTFERLFVGDEDYEDYDQPPELHTEQINHVVDLDGKLVIESVMSVPEMSLIGSLSGQDDYDESEHEGYTGNEGAPINYWYRDTVVMIVPRQYKVQLCFDNTSEESKLVQLLYDLRSKDLNDDKNMTDLISFCRLATKPRLQKHVSSWSMFPDTSPRNMNILVAETLVTLLDWDIFDEFERAIETVDIDILAQCGMKLGSAIMRHGFEALKARLDAVFQKSLESLTSQDAIFNAILRVLEAGDSLKQQKTITAIKKWRNEQTTKNLHLYKPKSAEDGKLLATISEHISDANTWQSLTSVITSSPFVARIAFVNVLFAAGSKIDMNRHGELLRNMLDTVWREFTFAKMTKQGGNQDARFDRFLPHPPKQPELTLDELVKTVNSSLSPSFGLGRAQLCDILRAKGLDASENDQLDLMTEFLGQIRKLQIPELLDEKQPLPECQELFTLFLAKYITGTMGFEPQRPADWRRDTLECRMNCDDCQTVNSFLADKSLDTKDMRVPLSNRKHLNSVFDSPYHKQQGWHVEIIKAKSPHVWRITKDNSHYSKDHGKWTRNKTKVSATLKSLEKAGPYWEAFLGPHYTSIMSGLAENVQYILQTPLSERQPATRTRQAVSGTKRHAEDKENNVTKKRRSMEEAEVIDLTS